MQSHIDRTALEATIAFHGHLCPGLMTGVRVAEVALREIGSHAQDEEVVAIVETDNCAVDAIQFLVGTTFGKGNLLHLDHGQNVFTFGRRSDRKAIRVRVKSRPRPPQSAHDEAIIARGRSDDASCEEVEALNALWRQRALAILDLDEDALLEIEELTDFQIPDKASLHPSIRCERCGQMTMATRIQVLDGRNLCIACYAAETGGQGVSLRSIGVVHNDLVPGEALSRARSSASRIELWPEYAEGLLGIEAYERLQILFCLHEAPANAPLRQHPQGDLQRPRRGVFALRSPHRPNPIGLTTVRLLEVEGNELVVSGLDAWDGSPVLDIKPYVGD
ncbi:MAG: tRNA (N6-threonylcarbamoyladenosine(37)-N6)-methyltransferase TrmO [Anaerolineae bacterium]|nr:tRNA (N6-threonylcarbamoyladenosine(37)-N6)-methyltransferase TrmO [Anaerolineae bacterium]